MYSLTIRNKHKYVQQKLIEGEFFFSFFFSVLVLLLILEYKYSNQRFYLFYLFFQRWRGVYYIRPIHLYTLYEGRHIHNNDCVIYYIYT